MDNIVKEMKADIREKLDVVVSKVKLGSETSVFVLEDGITHSAHMAKASDLGLL